MADELPPLVAQLIGDASDLYSTLSEVEAVLNAFANKEWTAELALDTSAALAELAAFESAADATHLTIPVTLDLAGAYAQLAALDLAAHGVGGGGGGGGAPGAAGGAGGADAAALASLLSGSRTTAGAQGISSLFGIPLPSGGGGGGGGGGLLAALGFGGGRIPFAAGFGTLGSLAGFGLESFATTGLGILGSGAGAVAGGAALGLGTAGVAGVGMGTDLAGIGQAAGDIRNTVSAINALNQAIAVYGQGSSQAITAQAQLNYVLAGFNPVAQAAVVQAANTAQGFKAMFDQATGAAESTGAQILTQLMQLGEKFLPTIGQFAAQNMTIIQAALQPLVEWIQGPGLSIFNQLERQFQNTLPAAMQAFDNGVELLIRVLGFLAPYTGKLVDDLAKWMTELNGADFSKLTGGIADAITIFRDWEGLIKAVGTAIYELFTHDAHTGTDIIVMLTDMVNRFNDWVKTTAGGDSLHSLLVSHRNEILAIIEVIGHLISTWGQLELAARPVIMDIVTGLATVFNFLSEIPGIGTILGLVVAFELLGSRIGFLGGLLGSFNGWLKNLALDGLALVAGGITMLGETLGGTLGGALVTAGGKLSAFTTVSATPMEDALLTLNDTMLTLDGTIGTLTETIGTLGPAATEMAAQVGTAAEAVQLSFTDMLAQVDAADADIQLSFAGVADAADAEAARVAQAQAAIGESAAGGAAAAGAGGGAAAGEAAGLGGLGAAEGATGGLVASLGEGGLLGLLGPIGIGLGLVAAAAYIVTTSFQHASGQTDTLFKTLNQGSAQTIPQLQSKLQQLQKDQQGVTQALAQSGVAGQAALNSYPDYTKVTQAIRQTSQALTTAQINTKALSAATGVGTGYINGLASALGINLSKALSPSQISAFTNYVHQNGGAAVVTGQQWTTASQNIQSALILMSAKAQQAMPGVSKAVADMVLATQPKLVTLESELGKTGNVAGQEMIAGFLANLSPAQLASKNMHDALKSPLDPLVTELRIAGDTSAADMVQAFINQKGPAQQAATNMHDSIKNPLYQLQTQLQTSGNISAAGFVQEFLAKNPEASSAAGLMHMAITGQLGPLEFELPQVAGTAGSNFVSSLNNAFATGNWSSLGSQIDSGIAGGISGSAYLPALAAAGAAAGALQAARHAISVGSPSRRAADEIGKPFSQGIALGIIENAGLVTAAARTVMGGSLPGNNSSLLGTIAANISPVTGSASQTTTVLNVTNPIQISGQTIAQIVTQYQLRGARATGNIAGQYAGGTQGQTATAINTNAVPR